MVAYVNPFQYVLSQHIIGGKFNKWIVILQEFDLDFQSAKSKRSVFFAKLISKFPIEENVVVEDDSFPYEYIFLISTSDPYYEYILIYLHNLKCLTSFLREERRKLRVNAKNYLIIYDTLYHRGVDSILHRCLTHEEVEHVLNDSQNMGVIYLG